MTDAQYEALKEQIISLQKQIESLVLFIGEGAWSVQETAWSTAYPSCSFPRKPDTQVIEELLKKSGPLHVSDIVAYGGQRGVSFEGTKPPNQMASDKLHSSKRFVLLGNNVWALPGQRQSDQVRPEPKGPPVTRQGTRKTKHLAHRRISKPGIRKGEVHAISNGALAS